MTQNTLVITATVAPAPALTMITGLVNHFVSSDTVAVAIVAGVVDGAARVVNGSAGVVEGVT